MIQFLIFPQMATFEMTTSYTAQALTFRMVAFSNKIFYIVSNYCDIFET